MKLLVMPEFPTRGRVGGCRKCIKFDTLLAMKDVIWLGNTRKVIQGLPTSVKHAIGTQLMMVQNGLDPFDWKPVKTIGPGVREIRIRVGGAYRIIYTAQYGNAVYVLHVFQKKRQKTSNADIKLARQRHAELQRLIK